MNRLCFADFAAFVNCKQLVMSVGKTGLSSGRSFRTKSRIGTFTHYFLLLIKIRNYLRRLLLNRIQLTVKLVYIFSIIILDNIMLESMTD